jgi:uncharacterized protein YbbC (DUF1343 family)
MIAATALAALAAPVKTGAETMLADNFRQLQGVKFGLVTNSTAVSGGRHILDLLATAGARPAVIFTPEHGLKAAAEDGVHLADGSDRGIPVISLYGKRRQPQPDELKGLELLVFDIQDIGVRFYTYISTMGLAMQAAAGAGIPFMVLDRPNPLGGEYAAGFVRSDLPATFTSQFPLPTVHGLTIGELALMIKGEAWLPGVERLDVRVVKMQGWQRWMRWPDTGLPWVATSPNIPDFAAALLYPGIGILEGTSANEGRGTLEPFRLAGWPGINGEQVAARLNRLQLPGVRFVLHSYTPVSIPGKATAPKWQNRDLQGIRVVITDYRSVRPVELGTAVTAELYRALPPRERQKFFHSGIKDMTGSAAFRQAIENGNSPEEISRLWNSQLQQFMRQRQRYLLYGNSSEIK